MKALSNLTGLDVDFVSLVSRAAVRNPSRPTEPMRFALTKSEVPVVDLNARGATTTEGGHMPNETEAELRAALEKAEQENAQLRKAAKKAAKKAGKKVQPTDANPDPDHDGDDDRTPEGDTDHDYQPPKGGKMSKSEEIAKAEERIQKAEGRAKQAEKIAKQERDLRVRSEFVEVAKSELGSLPGTADEKGAELHRLSDVLSKEEFDAHLTRQRAANEQLKKAERDLYGQIGRDGSPDPSNADAVDRVRKEAAEIRKADPDVSGYDAMRRALNANPDLILANR